MAEIPTDPRQWKLGDADAALKEPLDKAVGEGGFESNRLFMQGDHWQKGIYWGGPGRDSLGNILPSQEASILRHFTPCPIGPKCVRTRVNGACATEGDFTAIPKGVKRDDNGNPVLTAPEKTEADAWQLAAGEWWKTKALWARIKEQVEFGSIGKGACLRVFWHPRAIRDGTDAAGAARRGISFSSREEAFPYLEVSAPPPSECGVYLHPDTLDRIGIFRFKTLAGKDGMELWWVEDGVTNLRIFTQAEADGAWQFKWGGLLPIIPLEDVQPIFTAPVRRIQGAVDTTSTCGHKLGESHGYPQRDELNAMPAGDWRNEAPPIGTPQPIPPRGPDEGIPVVQYFWPSYRELGFGTTNSIPGLDYTSAIEESAAGTTTRFGVTTPVVQYHEPSPPDSILTLKKDFKFDLRSACYQGHISDDSTVQLSGDAYEQKRAEFESDIGGIAQALSNGVVPQTLTVGTVMADWSTGSDTADFAENWTVDAQVEADAGPESSEKQRGASEAVSKGHLSLRTYLVRQRVNDVPAEIERIAEQKTFEVVKAQAEAAAALIAAGWNARAAYKKAGYTDEEIEDAMRNDDIPPAQ